MRAPLRSASGFTLIEVTVAMSILALALMAIFDMNAGAVAMHRYTKKLSVATLLARSKMTDIEQQLYDKGFNADDEEDGGDFSEEGWPSYKWRAKIIAPKMDGISPEQVIGAIFGIPLMGNPDDKSGGGNPLGALGALLGGGAGGAAGAAGGLPSIPGLPGLPSGGPTSGGGGLLSMLGPLASTQFQQMVDQIGKSVREIHLTVTWKEGKQVESIDLVTHIVSPGPGSDRNGAVVAGQSAASTQQAASGPMVDAITGAAVPNPAPGPNGTFINPATGNQAVPGNGTLPTTGTGAPGATRPNPIQTPVPSFNGLLGQPPRILPGVHP